MLIDFLKSCDCVLKEEELDYSDVLNNFRGNCSVSMLPIVTIDLWPVYALECGSLGNHLPNSHNSTYIVPLDIRSFFCGAEVSALLSAFYDDRNIENNQNHYGAEIEEVILLRNPSIEKTIDVDGLGKTNVVYIKISFASGNTAQLFLIAETPEFCWTELYEKYDIAMDILIHSRKGLGDWFPNVKLFSAMRTTQKPDLLPRLYFEGKYINDSSLFNSIKVVDKIDPVYRETMYGAVTVSDDFSTVWEIDLTGNM